MLLPRVLRALFVLVSIAGVVTWVLPVLLYLTSAPFPGRLPATLLFFAVVGEKLSSTFLRQPDKVRAPVATDWTVPAVGLSYVLVMVATIVDVYVRREGLPSAWSAGLGGLVYSTGLALRLAALRSLGAAWSIQLDRADPWSGALIRDGLYGKIRHPIYLGAMLETVGLALLFHAGWALALAVVLFCPAELARARFEENCLRAHFGAAYAAYARAVPGFLPRFGVRP